jgi:hypothetical protein
MPHIAEVGCAADGNKRGNKAGWGFDWGLVIKPAAQTVPGSWIIGGNDS